MALNNLDTLYRQVIMDHYKSPRNKGSLDGDVLSVDMNNPTCGDRIQLHLQVADGIVKDAKFEGEGCSISIASASMMTQAIKGLELEKALKMSNIFSKMMMGEKVDTEGLDLGDIEALQGVAKFPARIKCATLSWKAMEKGVKENRK
ncbi:Fe-S cluster assembly sulfur transfer protein SufU [Virgibacillus proomii]|jgi:nitrogen fixation protein NifU and related proteins|uniref:Fe-S cluster assembly sulfur transfer protein SufU n=1 Tax=Virgibacillus proomii TaxID=84407 RepID=UPI0009865AD1|nr:SUF system NifU family Fe-S cluster assembly protein [Virgibacillus proomii]MBU5267296.1 SUF system NifU family Fe-S cluster assembly protein [Virgibacillus proomii]